MTEGAVTAIKKWGGEVSLVWDQFWFTPRTASTLAVIRMACGAMLAYVHIVWAFVLADFFGAQAWITTDVVRQLHRADWTWSWLWYVENVWLLMLHQLVAIVASLCMMLGLLTRLTTVVAWWMTLMVCHRLTGALFGLDQILIMLSMYLMWSHAGSEFSLDARLRRRFAQGDLSQGSANRLQGWWGWLWPDDQPATCNNVATRLIQLHLCVIYLFGGLSKMRGEMWFDGSALWYTVVNYEYQSLDITWLGRWRLAIAALTALTIFWETFYIATVWPRLTRPITLGLAVLVHGGIAVALGMVTFGTIMIVANLAFIEPAIMARWLGRSQLLSAKLA